MKRFSLSLTLKVLLVALIFNGAAAHAQGPVPPKPSPQLIEQVLQATQGQARISYHGQTNHVRFIGTSPDYPILHPATLANNATPEVAARALMQAYGSLFGLTDQSSELQLVRIRNLDRGRSNIRFQQVYKGIPIFGGELAVNLDKNNNMLSSSGELLPNPRINVVPAIDSGTAQQYAIALVAKQYTVQAQQIATTKPELWIYGAELIGGSGSDIPALVWRLTVQSAAHEPIQEQVMVDAHHGNIVLHFSQIESALNRQTYTANNQKSLPGTLVCDEANPSCNGGDSDAIAAHRYAADTYNFYLTHHRRDSINGMGMPLISTVHYDKNWRNALWNGSQMQYGDGFSNADDVVGHEFTHGVTDYESNLVYLNESGAINESLSDIWGEFIDLTNGSGNDGAAVRWELGEDLPGGAIRDMRDPTLYRQPDRMSSPYWKPLPTVAICDEKDPNSNDCGWVHENSGVNNKAAYLMVDGGTFNGFTVTGLGIDKVAVIYYEAQTNLLTSGSDYDALADALEQACRQSLDKAGITQADCVQVSNALWATEIRSIHVSTTGNDQNDCLSQDQACRTIGAAVAKAADGGTIAIAPGIYTEHLTISKRVRLVGQNVIIR